MQSIGFIGSEQDIQQRFKLLEQIYGKGSVSILKAEVDEQKPNEFHTVEDLVQNTELVFFGNHALANRPLLYHTIKKANRLFLDIQSPLSKSTILKCKAYQEEAGSIVSFNINPYLVCKSILSFDAESTNHALIRSFYKMESIEMEVYKYLLFGYFFLDCITSRVMFNVIPDADGTVKVVNLSLTNVKGKHINMIVGNYGQNTNKYQLFNSEGIMEKNIPGKKFFNDSKILKQQLDALYINKQLADLNQAAGVVELMDKMKEKMNQ
jgi:hypothetical protein